MSSCANLWSQTKKFFSSWTRFFAIYLFRFLGGNNVLFFIKLQLAALLALLSEKRWWECCNTLCPGPSFCWSRASLLLPLSQRCRESYHTWQPILSKMVSSPTQAVMYLSPLELKVNLTHLSTFLLFSGFLPLSGSRRLQHFEWKFFFQGWLITF